MKHMLQLFAIHRTILCILQNMNVIHDGYNRRKKVHRQYFCILICMFSILCIFEANALSAVPTDMFVDSLRSLQEQPDVEVITIDETPRRKKFTPSPQVTVKPLERDIWGGVSLGSLSTPMPKFEDYLIRELTPDEYSKFYAAFTEGQLASKENNLREAVRYYTEAISVAPFYYVGYMERAKILLFMILSPI